MESNFPAALAHVLRAEGGYVNHPADPGGCTNRGITLATLRAYRIESLSRKTSCEDVKALTESMAAEIYRDRYWNKVRAGALPAGIDLIVFDMAVNAGPKTAAKLLQRIVGVDADGKIGPITLKATSERYAADPLALLRDYTAGRETYYRSLRHFSTFGKGWLNRVADATEAALVLLGSPQTPSLENEQDIIAELLALVEKIGILATKLEASIRP